MIALLRSRKVFYMLLIPQLSASPLSVSFLHNFAILPLVCHIAIHGLEPLYTAPTYFVPLVSYLTLRAVRL